MQNCCGVVFGLVHVILEMTQIDNKKAYRALGHLKTLKGKDFSGTGSSLVGAKSLRYYKRLNRNFPLKGL